MSLKKKLLIASGTMIAIGVVVIVLSVTRFFTPEPKFECVEQGQPSAGFSDDSQGGCPISIESYNKWRDWEYPEYRRVMGISSVLLLLSGVIVGVVGLTKKSPKSKA